MAQSTLDLDVSAARYGHGLTTAHVVTRYLRGGSERRIRDLVEALPAAQHDVYVGADSDVALALRETHATQIRTIPTLVREPRPVSDARAVAALVRALRERPYDLVVTHQSKAGVLGRIAARRAGISVVHSLSMPSFGEAYPGWRGRVFRMLERRLARSTSAYAVVGKDVARRYRSIGVPADKLHIVRSGVPLPDPTTAPDGSSVRRRHGLPPAPLLLYLGSLEPRKNVLDLAPLLSALARESGPCPHLVVAGEGPLAEPLAKELAERGVADMASLLGYVADPMPLVRTAAVLVLLSDAEGMPQVLVQAAACGTPFVAYDVDGVRELLALGAEGIAVERGDLPAAAEAIHGLLRRPADASSPSIDVTPWTRDTIAAGYREVVSRALASRSAAVTS